MRLFARLLLAAGLLNGALALAAERPVLTPDQVALEKQMCASGKCQYGLHIVLRTDGETYDKTMDIFPPVVQEHGLIVVAGQTIYIEADLDGNRLVNMVAVDSVKLPKKTITAKLEQVDGKGMLLTVQNPFSKPLKFDMVMMPLARETLSKTSSCPVVAGGAAFESWPYPIFQLLLMNARLLEPGDKMACVE